MHKPNPADYQFLTSFYQGPSLAAAECYQDANKLREEYVRINPIHDGRHANSGTCDHCGAAFHYGAVFSHTSGVLYHFGHLCADNLFSLPNLAMVARRKAAKAIKRENVRRKALESNPWIYGVAIAAYAYGEHTWTAGFCQSMVANIARWGSLSPKQAATLFKAVLTAPSRIKAQRERAAAEAAKPSMPVPEGKAQMLTGTIISSKWRTTGYGVQHKMLVEDDRGFRIWLTVPTPISDEVDRRNTENKEQLRITLIANLEQSRDDENFGFGKRPRKAQIA